MSLFDRLISPTDPLDPTLIADTAATVVHGAKTRAEWEAFWGLAPNDPDVDQLITQFQNASDANEFATRLARVFRLARVQNGENARWFTKAQALSYLGSA